MNVQTITLNSYVKTASRNKWVLLRTDSLTAANVEVAVSTKTQALIVCNVRNVTGNLCQLVRVSLNIKGP